MIWQRRISALPIRVVAVAMGVLPAAALSSGVPGMRQGSRLIGFAAQCATSHRTSWPCRSPGERGRATSAISFDRPPGAAASSHRLRMEIPSEGTTFPAKPRVAVAIAGCRTGDGGALEWLLIRRAKAPSIGQWSLPGGSVELGEGSLPAAKRELLEETGISGVQVSFHCEPFMASDSITREGGGVMFHYMIAQMFAVVSKDATAKAGDDALDVGWFTTAKIATQEFGLVTDGVLGVVKRAETLYRAGLLDPAD